MHSNMSVIRYTAHARLGLRLSSRRSATRDDTYAGCESCNRVRLTCVIIQRRIDMDKSYKLSSVLLGHTADVRAVATFADGTVVSVSRDKTARVWKPTGLVPVARAILPHDRVRDIRFPQLTLIPPPIPFSFTTFIIAM